MEPKSVVKSERFSFVIDPAGRRAIETLASKMGRSQSDAVRMAVITAAQILDEFPDFINLPEAVVASPTAH